MSKAKDSITPAIAAEKILQNLQQRKSAASAYTWSGHLISADIIVFVPWMRRNGTLHRGLSSNFVSSVFPTFSFFNLLLKSFQNYLVSELCLSIRFGSISFSGLILSIGTSPCLESIYPGPSLILIHCQRVNDGGTNIYEHKYQTLLLLMRNELMMAEPINEWTRNHQL